MTLFLSKEDIQELKKGNTSLFENIFLHYFGRLVSYATEYVSDREVAKEVVQDAFMRLWENRKVLRDDSNIQSYLYTLTRNLCLNHLKRVKNSYRFIEYTRKEELILRFNRLALEDKSAEGLLTFDLENKIREAIDSLPQQCKRVFILSRFEGMKNRQISEKLNITVKAVEANISRAMKHLSVQLKDFL